MIVSLGIILAGALGVLSHLCYFIRGEHHLRAPVIVRLYLAGFPALLVFERTLYAGHLRDAIKSTISISGAYAFSLFLSIIVYRLFFHRLRNFPGPVLARATKFYHMLNVQKCDQYLFLEKLHCKYGDYVRTGPSEVTIFSPEAISQVLGPASQCSKSLWWEMMWPQVSMVTTRSKTNHSLRRRAWDMGFSTKAIQNHEPYVQSYAKQLESRIESLSRQPVNVTQLFELYTFDIMGDMNFGIKFHMLREGRVDPAIQIFKTGMQLMGPFTPVPWLFHVAVSIPGLQRGWRAFKGWADQRLRFRLDEAPEKTDSISWVIDHAQDQGGVQVRYDWLLGDFICLMSAASEPVLCTMVFLFYHLVSAPAEIQKLRVELQTLSDCSDNRALQTLPHLNGLVNETLRLHPPVPSAGLRDTPPEGLTLGSTYIPGNTTVLIPQYSLGRREDCYEHPNSFIPERWYSRPELIKNRNAFIPFNAGEHACIGKNLGLMEIRLAVALLVSKYDISFAPGETGIAVSRDLVDLFVATPGPLQLRFERRKDVA